jgi:hypothetical protein
MDLFDSSLIIGQAKCNLTSASLATNKPNQVIAGGVEMRLRGSAGAA